MELKATYPYGKTLGEFATSPVLWGQYWTLPNVLSTLRGTLGVIMQIWLMIVAADTWWPLINLAFWTATDFVDGYLAKYHGMASDLGKVIDTLADKLLIIVTLVVLAMQLLVQVVATVQNADACVPRRCSLPSMWPPASGTSGLSCCSK